MHRDADITTHNRAAPQGSKPQISDQRPGLQRNRCAMPQHHATPQQQARCSARWPRQTPLHFAVLAALLGASGAAAQCINTIVGQSQTVALNLGNGGFAVDPSGVIFFAVLDVINGTSPSGTTFIAAGGGSCSDAALGDGGSAARACLRSPAGVVVDTAGNLIIADTGNSRVRKVWAANGTIVTIAGGAAGCTEADGAAAALACVDPRGLAADRNGNVFVVELYKSRVRKIAAASGVITTVLGGGCTNGGYMYGDGAYTGEGGPATAACVTPWGAAVTSNGDLLVSHSWTGETEPRILRVSDGRVVTLAGGINCTGRGDGNGGSVAQACFVASALAVGQDGELYFADDRAQKVRKVWANGTITTIAGGGSCPWFLGDGGPATAACVSTVGLAVDGSGALLIADGMVGIRRVAHDHAAARRVPVHASIRRRWRACAPSMPGDTDSRHHGPRRQHLHCRHACRSRAQGNAGWCH